MKKIAFAVISWSLCLLSSYAQLSTRETPMGFNSGLNLRALPVEAVKSLPSLNMQQINEEDRRNDGRAGYLPRFGYSHSVGYTLQNSGVWQTLPNGDRLWRLRIVCSGALSINLVYDKFWIPQGGKLFIYTTDKKQAIGAFTSLNNKGDKLNIRGFATGLLFGDDITLEYYQPRSISEQAVISVSKVVHGYRYINVGDNTRVSGGSDVRNINVNCPEGKDWQKEKRAVALMVIEGGYFGTGALVNSTAQDGSPLFLTAHHCISDSDGFAYDAMTEPRIESAIFYWNYETTGCENEWVNMFHCPSLSGAVVLANEMNTDFALLRLSEDPRLHSEISPYYLGWDRSGAVVKNSVSIHHPMVDVKKISVDNDAPTNVPNSIDWLNAPTSPPNTHWRVIFDRGVQQGGSSGSPLINANRHVIGQLHGHSGDLRIQNFGKLSVSWLGYGMPNNKHRRLKDWLDPLNTGQQTLDGMEASGPFSGPSLICDQATYTMTNFPENRRVHWQASNDKVRLVSGQGTSSAVFARNAEQNGEVTISVYVDDVEVASQKVWVGVPVIRIQEENSIHERRNIRYYLCLNSVGTMSNSFWIEADGLDDQETWEYQKISQFTLHTAGNTVFFHGYNELGVIFRARVRNACGWSEWHMYDFPVLVCEGERPTPRRVPSVYDRDDKSIYVLQPIGTREDKASATTTMRSVRSVSTTTDMGYEVQIWDKNNKLVRSVKSSSAYLRIPFADYPKGLYVVRIIHNGEATSHKIWVP